MSKIRVGYIGASKPVGTNHVWGGAQATVNAFLKSFKNDDEVEIIHRDRKYFKNAKYIEDFRKVVDILHVDDTSTLSLMYSAGLNVPDIVGPIDRSPLKNYAGWKAPYTKKWFYGAKAIMRLNYAEEYLYGKYDMRNKVSLIKHGVDTDKLIPKKSTKKYILWAGMIPRPAKNYGMMEDIIKFTELIGGLPDGYEFKILSKFNVRDYWKILDKTAILINTSKYESFCSAIYEAQSKGVPTIYRKGLHGLDINKDSRIQVKYTPKAYYEKIIELLNNKKLINKESRLARKYVVDNFSLKKMNETYKEVYKRVWKARGCTN